MSDELLRDLGSELPWDRPDGARRDAVRSSLLIAASEGAPPRPRRRWLTVGTAFAAGALAAALTAIVLLPADRTPARPSGSARITASSGAQLEHGTIPTATGLDEIVRVRDGSVRVAVAPPRTGDHVRVRTHNADVEGTGEYDVDVSADLLTSVTVRAGSAEIKLAGQRPIFLAAGQTWRATVVATELLSPSAAPPSPPPSPPPPAPAPASVQNVRKPDIAKPDTSVPRPISAAIEPTPQLQTDVPVQVPPPAPPSPPAPSSETRTSELERRFQTGWALLRAGKAREAAIELGAAADAGEGDPLAADARYFQAVALVRSSQRPEAERVLVQFLDRAPRSLRRGRASVLLAQLIEERGDRTSARAWFQSAVDDPDPAISSAARAGVARLDAHP